MSVLLKLSIVVFDPRVFDLVCLITLCAFWPIYDEKFTTGLTLISVIHK